MNRFDEVTPAESLENLAARIVEAESSVSACRNDVRGGPPGQVDFKITDALARTGLLEVTSVPDSRLNATTSEIVKGTNFVLPHSQFIWVVTFDANRTVTRRMTRRLTRALGDLERSHLIGRTDPDRISIRSSTLSTLGPDPIPTALNDELHDMGVLHITTRGTDQPTERGVIHWALTAGVTRVSTNGIIDAVNQELQKCDNRKKLAPAAKTGRAELFVWLDAPGHRIAAFNIAEPSIPQPEEPIPLPILPAEISAVWVAPTPAGRGTAGPYWHSDGGPWVKRLWSVSDDLDIDLLLEC